MPYFYLSKAMAVTVGIGGWLCCLERSIPFTKTGNLKCTLQRALG
jgi:hypothetical protein